jgi:N-acetylglucosamine-6-phosphate deacetylase
MTAPVTARLYGRVFAPDDLGMRLVTIADERIVAIEPTQAPPDDAINMPGSIIVPGFVDLQLNGAFGEDFSDESADLGVVCGALPRHGVTSFLPTVVSSAPERYAGCLANLARSDRPSEARVLGVHLEGPFISPAHAGTHDRDMLRAPDRAEARAWLDAGNVRIVTLAPELPGALDLIGELAQAGVVVAAGHTGASWPETERAAAAGIRLGTHIFNAMRPLHHRDPGIVGFLLASEIPVSVIADGRHMTLETLSVIAAAKGVGGLIGITDGLAGLGMPPGEFLLAGQRVISDGTVAALPNGTLSGSVLPLPRMVANLNAAGLAPEEAVRAVTETPAQLLGVNDRIGTLRPGSLADLVVLDAEWQPLVTFVGGVLAWRAEREAA